MSECDNRHMHRECEEEELRDDEDEEWLEAMQDYADYANFLSLSDDVDLGLDFGAETEEYPDEMTVPPEPEGFFDGRIFTEDDLYYPLDDEWLDFNDYENEEDSD